MRYVEIINETTGYDPLERGPSWDSELRKWIEDEPPNKQTVEINGVLRPLYNSENGLIAPTFDMQNAFWHWFDNSKIVDRHGRPLVVHRGDKVGKTTFTGRENKSNYIQGNIFFTSERYIARGYTPHRTNYRIDPKDMNQSHGLYSAYLKIKNPLVVDAKGEDWARIPISGRLKKIIGSHRIQIDDLALYVQENTKNDGLIVKNVMDQFGDGHQFVVFSNEQIKLIK